MMKVQRLLERLTDRILAVCDPERIILFGSYAKGTQTLSSDIDLLVVGEFDRNARLTLAELRQALYPSVIAVDVHIASPQDLEANKLTPHGFMFSIQSTGISLYEKPNTSFDRPNSWD